MTKVSKSDPVPVRGLLLDLEGVLYQDGTPIAGARNAVRALGDAGLSIRFLTNTTTRPRRSLVTMLASMGFTAQAEQVFTPAVAAAGLLHNQGLRRVHLAADESLAEDLGDVDLVDRDADAVVMGDLYRAFTWDRLNMLYRLLADGAQLIALHRNRYCRRAGELALDLGPFVAALEYASGREATVVGKPSNAFFAQAVADLGVPSDQVVMIGDDIEADIMGAIAAGIPAIQVKTGKFHPRDEDKHPHLRLDSVAALPNRIAIQS